MQISLIRLDHGEGLPLPFYATEGSVGADIAAALEEDLILKPGERALIPTGFSPRIPEGYEIQLRSRSGLSWKNGVIVLNSPATIDWDYKGEIKVVLGNLGNESFTVSRGLRIAQMVVAPVTRAIFHEICSPIVLNQTGRGNGGFGSTGH